MEELKVIKRSFQHRCFPVKFANFLITPIFKNTLLTIASQMI